MEYATSLKHVITVKSGITPCYVNLQKIIFYPNLHKLTYTWYKNKKHLTHTVQKYKAHVGSHSINTSPFSSLPISHLKMAIGQHSQYYTAKEHKIIRISWQNIQFNISRFITIKHFNSSPQNMSYQMHKIIIENTKCHYISMHTNHYHFISVTFLLHKPGCN